MRSHFVEKLNRVQILFPFGFGKIAIAEVRLSLCNVANDLSSAIKSRKSNEWRSIYRNEWLNPLTKNEYECSQFANDGPQTEDGWCTRQSKLSQSATPALSVQMSGRFSNTTLLYQNLRHTPNDANQ